MIGRAVGRLLGHLADAALNRAAPLDAQLRAYLAMQRVGEWAAADRLADTEAATEVTEPTLERLSDLRDACADDACADTTEPPLAAWERELRDAFRTTTELPDDLWAAEQRAGTITNLPDGNTIDDLINSRRLPTARPDDAAADFPAAPSGEAGGRPVGAAALPPPQPAGGADRATTTKDLASVIAVVLRGRGINSAPFYADLAAEQLAQHFTFRRK